MAMVFFLVYLIFTLGVLYRGMQSRIWEVGSAIYLIIATFFIGMPLWLGLPLWVVIAAVVAVLELEPLRLFITDYLYKSAGKSIPKLSKTEEEALNAGDTWLEQDIFRGSPDWARLSAVTTDLSEEEQAFLNNETQVLCSMLDEWEIGQDNDLPAKVWTYMKEQGFFGLVIPKEFGGKGFSARAHSDVVLKIASRSGVAAVTVMVPNSLGPGELLNYYGTPEQKNYYLPRLARGTEVPCFALTEPGAGSDATSIQSTAIVEERSIDGKTVLGLNLTFDKRWITLAPVATLIGLAVQLKDPDGLLKGEGEEGITCILIPRDTEGLEIGNRHLPGSQPFMNGTVRGTNVFVPITTIIGGQAKAGRGWQMLVECLSIGRSISLPALGAASSAVAYLTTGAFARVRKQFNVEIAQFEGVQEKLAEIAGLNYLINANRLLTAAAVNEHKKPSVASAITKYFNTELARDVMSAAMDVHAGRAVVVGPRNYLSNHYQGIPISITVEGANVMTRNLLIFGQGSMACHPFIREEFYAISRQDKEAFGVLIWKHIHYFCQNLAKAVSSAWTGGVLISAPRNSLKREYQRLGRLSHAFAWMADLSLIYLGGDLKRKERLSARLADGMSYLYLAMAALRMAERSGHNEEECLHAKWATAYCFYHAQQSLIGLTQNMPSKLLGTMMRLVAFPFGQTMRMPSDKLSHQLAKLMTSNNNYRNELKKQVFLSADPSQPVDRMEHALQLIIGTDALAEKYKDIKRCSLTQLKESLQNKVQLGELSETELEQIVAKEEARWDAVLVDEFTFDSMKKKHFNSVIDSIHSPLL